MSSLFSFIDLLGTFVFALSGAIAGVKKGFDLFGIFVVSAVTAVGGGVIRDLCLSATPPVGLENIEYLGAVILAIICVSYFQKKILSLSGISNFLDAIGLGFFAAFGANKTWYMTGSIQLAIILGCITAVGGGCIRDVLTGRPPLIFQAEIYASAAIVGASIELLGSMGVISPLLSPWLAIIACIVIRMLAIKYNLKLPFINNKCF